MQLLAGIAGESAQALSAWLDFVDVPVRRRDLPVEQDLRSVWRPRRRFIRLALVNRCALPSRTSITNKPTPGLAIAILRSSGDHDGWKEFAASLGILVRSDPVASAEQLRGAAFALGLAEGQLPPDHEGKSANCSSSFAVS